MEGVLSAIGRPTAALFGKLVPRISFEATELDAGALGVYGNSEVDPDSGQPKAFAVAGIQTFDGKGEVAIFNKDRDAIAHLAESDKIPNTGRITLGDAEANGVFAAGGMEEGGEVCHRVGKKMECLGIDLPLSIHTDPK